MWKTRYWQNTKVKKLLQIWPKHYVLLKLEELRRSSVGTHPFISASQSNCLVVKHLDCAKKCFYYTSLFTFCPSLTSITSSHPLRSSWRRLTWSFVSFIAVCYSMWPYKHQRFNWLNTRWQNRLLTWIWLLMNTYCDVGKITTLIAQVYSWFISYHIYSC